MLESGMLNGEWRGETLDEARFNTYAKNITSALRILEFLSEWGRLWVILMMDEPASRLLFINRRRLLYCRDVRLDGEEACRDNESTGRTDHDGDPKGHGRRRCR